ncbi:MAG: NAD(+) diphosphatase [Fibromonadales bacterium]|nr:NAD(+) diphosphatase [Fibromonadales bacterium]
MLHDIYPKIFNNTYFPKMPSSESNILYFINQKAMVKFTDGNICFPVHKDFESHNATFIYLFRIDDADFFLAVSDADIQIDGFCFENINLFRNAMPRDKAFAGITAYHLNCWYSDNKFCGRCKNEMEYAQKERMLFCSKCGKNVYPKICPAIIVGVINGDYLLMTKYAHSVYKNYSLVAGFVEIGESAEDAVKREVMEETGLNVKNIRYYKSQPWGFSDSLLFGFFADLDGKEQITMDENELSEAAWVHRGDIQMENNGLSLTNEMICIVATD